MTRDEVIVGMLEAALSAYRHGPSETDDGRMLEAIRAAFAWLDHQADLSGLDGYARGEWSRMNLHAMRIDLELLQTR